MEIWLYTASNNYFLYDSERAPSTFSVAGNLRKNTNRITAASLSLELNRAGSLTITVPKDHVNAAQVAVGANRIKIKDPPMIRTRNDAITSGNDTWYEWHGRLAKLEETPTTYKATYEGQLSWLSTVVVPPYNQPSKSIVDMFGYYMTIYNARTSFPLGYEIDDDPVSYLPPDGELILTEDEYKLKDYVNASYSTVWDGISANVIADRDYVIAFVGTSTIKVKLTRYSSSGSYTEINRSHIQNGTHTIDFTKRATRIYGLGGHFLPGEGDNGRAYNRYTASDDQNRLLPKSDMIIRYPDSVEEAEVVAELAEKSWSEQFVTTDSVTLTVLNTGRRYAIGTIYHIVDDRMGIDGNYKLISANCDILNPATATLTFGTVKDKLSRITGKKK